MSCPTSPRIGIDVRFVPDFPGVGRYVEQLVRALVDEGADLVLCRRSPVANGSPLDDLDGRVAWVDLPDSPRSPLDRWRSPWRIADGRVDVFHSPHLLGPRSRCPRVLTLHDLIPILRPETLASAWRRRLYRRVLRTALSSARLLICPSTATRRHLEERWAALCDAPPVPIEVVPDAAAPHFRPAEPAIVEALRRRLRLTRPYVLWLGALRPHKNVAALLEAWRHLGPTGQAGHQLVLAGKIRSGWRPLRRQVAALEAEGSVRDLGAVDDGDLPGLYSGASLFVLPSLDEGFGLPLVEAMACGTPVACARAGALPEVAGDAAEIFDPVSAEDIGRCLAGLLATPGRRAELAARGLRRAATFSWRFTARAHLAAYRRALA